MPKQTLANNINRGKIWLIITLFIVIIGVVFFLSMYPPGFYRPLLNITLTHAFLLLLTSFISMGVNGLFLREFTSKFGIDLTILEWFGLSVVTTMGNYITPFSGGMLVRATYLKRKYAFPYSKFMSMLAANYLVIFWMIGIVGTVILIKWVNDISSIYVLLGFFMTIVCVISIILLVPSIKLAGGGWLAGHINEALNGWDMIRKDGRLLSTIVAYAAINMMTNGLSFWIAYNALGATVPFKSAFLVSLFVSFSLLINITPGNLGVQEVIVGLSSGLLGIGAGLGLVAALLVRASAMLIAFSLGPIFSVSLTRKLGTS
jgi:uncharacterized membrane protein YbhN (UPF0104 family)